LPAKKFRKKKRRNIPRIYFDIFNQQEHAKGYIKTLFQEVLSQLTSTRKTNPTPNQPLLVQDSSLVCLADGYYTLKSQIKCKIRSNGRADS
jgi:hypothetical protein